MKTFLTIVLIVVIVGFGIFYSKQSFDNIDFEFDFGGIDWKNVSVSSQGINVLVTVKNKNTFPIPFSNLLAKFFYNGKLIAQSSKVDTNNYSVPPNGQLQFIEKIDLFLVDISNISLLQKLVTKQKVEINYQVNIQVFKVTLPTIQNSFNIPY